MNTEVLTLNINSSVFDSMKNDFNSVLKKTLANMRSKQGEAAEISLKLKITLEEDNVPDLYSEDGNGRRDIVKPIFNHKVSSVMQIKEEESGSMKGNYELVYDKEKDDFIMRPIDDGQVTFADSMFTTSEEPQEAEFDDFDDSDETTDDGALPGRPEVPQLGAGNDTEEAGPTTNSAIKYGSKLFFNKPEMKAVILLTHKWVGGEDGSESSSEFTSTILPYSTILECSEKCGYDSLFDELECACSSLTTESSDKNFGRVHTTFFSGTHNHITDDVTDEKTAEFLVECATYEAPEEEISDEELFGYTDIEEDIFNDD